ncbi:MAG: response regulator transcription factor [Bacilli bacterium]|nr:response regulator transcription factor [Bacilli bacterium]
MYKILVVDDEEKIRNLISKYARFENNEIIESSNGMEAIVIAKNNDIDIIIMDVMMPELDGFSTVREIRKFSNVPVIMLSARGEEYDRIHGFEVGVDDYVVKPFSPKELMMRIDAIMKRKNNSEKLNHDIYFKDDLKVDFSARKIFIEDQSIDVAPKEYELLFYFIKNKGIALSRERILSDVWGYNFFGDDRTLDTHIKLLRKHLNKYGSLIVTLRGTGYRFEG